MVCLSQELEIGQLISNKTFEELNSKIDSHFESDFLINNGRHYIPLYQRIKGHPYFNTNKSVKGNILLGNRLYKDIQLIYNLYQNCVICYVKCTESDELPITLNNQAVTGFTIDGHEFVNSNLIIGVPANGFYEIVYEDDNLKCYAKWTKKYLEIYTREYLGEFDAQHRTLYVLTDKGTQEIQSKRSFLDVFGSKRKKVKAFMQKNNMKYSKMSNSAFYQVFQFYKELSK
jgi:hypothetical protein